MSDFYGIGPDEVPGFVGMADQWIAFEELPESTRAYIGAMLEHLRTLHAENPLAFEAVILFVAQHIDDLDRPPPDNF